MARILLIAHRIPYPPDKGDKLRSWAWLQGLSACHSVDLVCFVDDPADHQYEDLLAKYCDQLSIHNLSRVTKWTRLIKGLLTRKALSEAAYQDARARHSVETALGKKPDAVLLFSSGPFALLPSTLQCPLIADLVDVDSAKWQSYADQATSIGMRWIYRREARSVGELERRIARKAEHVLFVSTDEAALFRKTTDLPADVLSKVQAVGNGVALETFSSEHGYENPYGFSTAPIILFTGAMDYPPNVDAVRRFACSIFPLIKNDQPDAEFWIVGARPTAQVTDLACMAHVHVTGRVDSIQPYFAHADVCVAPLSVARGVQNKVLEAMAMGKPMVATSAAATGIQACDETHVLIADRNEDFAEKVLHLLNSPNVAHTMGADARKVIERHYTWPEKVAELMRLMRLSTT